MKTIIYLVAFVFLSLRSYSQTAAWIRIDSMDNAKNIVCRYHNPIAYDPYSKVVAVVYPAQKRVAGSSGNIFYHYSTDNGSTWTAAPVRFDAKLPNGSEGQFPTVTLSNPRHSLQKDSVLVDVAFSFQRTNASDGLAYGVDPGVGAASFLVSIDTSAAAWGSHFAFWVSDNSDDTWFAGFGGVTKSISVLHAADGVTYTKTSPKQFADSNFRELDGIVRGVYRNGTCWIAVRAKFTNAADTSLMTLGVSSSTDRGKTWSTFDIVNFHSIAGLSTRTSLPSNDFAVDGAGTCHWLAALVDTTIIPNKWILVDIYKPSGGSWSATKIRDLPIHENWRYGSLNDSHIENELSVSKSGKFVAAKWLEDNRGAAFKDSVPLADIYVSYSGSAGSAWMLPENVTSTPTEDEQLTHLAPVFEDGNFTIYLTRFMQSGSKRYPDENAPTVLYFSKYFIYDLDWTYIHLSSPAGGEIWEAGSVQKIAWDCSVVQPEITIQLSTDNGLTWQLISKVRDSSSPFSWTVPDSPSGLCKISIGGYLMFGYSTSVSSTFTIKEKPVGVKTQGGTIPHEFFLAQNYPNPFNPSTTFEYGIPENALVRLGVCDILGRELKVLVDGKQPAGTYTARADLSAFSSGIYFIRMKAGSFHQIRKIALIK